ncbi:MAG: hypothetical protein K2P44_12600 [Lachnospiraceae bacterium]|nr:hypothetical protein [Lachnospiraceae bacterium]
MVSILLTVLKIIGIAILVILGLLIMLLLFVLFVPVRYRAKGDYHDNHFATDMRVTWLLHAASFKAEYCIGQVFHMRLKIFGITVYDNLKTTGKKFKNKKRKSTKNKSGDVGEIQAASFEDTSESENEVPQSGFLENYDEKEFAPAQNLSANIDENQFDSEKETHKWHFLRKIKIIFRNFVNFFKNIKFTFQKIYDTIVRIKDNIKYYLELLQLDSTKQAVTVCRKQLGWVFKKISPKKFRINLHLGFEDPAVMGEVLAVWGMFYPMHQGNIDIQPEFDQSVIEGSFFLKGCISVFVFVKVACVLYFDKNLKLLIRHLKRNKI